MRCVFLDSDDKCHAGLTYEEQRNRDLWKVDEEAKKAYCTMNTFINCPRFKARMESLKKTSS